MADEKRNGKKKVDYRRAWPEARELIYEHRRSMVLGLLVMVVNRLSGLVLPYSSGYVIDTIIGKSRADMLVPVALIVGGATVVQGLTGFVLSQVVSVAGQRAIANMRKRVEAHVLRLPIRYFDKTQTGILISRIMTDAEGIRNLVGTGLVQLTGGVVTAVIAMGVLFWLNWKLTAFTLVLLGIFAVITSYTFKRLRPMFRERGQINAEVTGRLSQALGGIRVLKAYVAERREDRVFAHGVHRLFRNVARTITGTSAVSAISTVIVGINGVVLIIVGGRAVLGGTMTLGDLVRYVFFEGLMVAPLVQISSIGTQITDAFAGLDRIRELRDMKTEGDEDRGRLALEDLQGDVAFDRVTFEYDPGVPVLRDVSFHAPAGTTTALVGPSGSGKSTLISLVMAFNHPLRGRVLVDGGDLAELRMADFRRHLGVVMQDNFLFDGTVGENIAFASPGASHAEIRAASRLAHCDEFIERFEKGYDTVVGERGVRLSGGQRQRVAIARAVLANPRLLILDEATSSLDSESESLIQDGLRRLRQGRTTFVIAHRLSTIMSADQILVMDDGRIVESGSHDELLERGGLYRRLYDKQYRLERNRFINPGEDPDAGAESPASSVQVSAGDL